MTVRGLPFQIGVLVQDLDAARAELTTALGLTWGDVLEREVQGAPLRVCFSLQGPPYTELIQGPAGSPWDPGGPSRIDHVGYWADDIRETRDELAAAGLDVEVDGTSTEGNFTYHRGRESGLRVELIDRSTRRMFYERFGLDDPEAT